MKVTLEFTLPEERPELELALQAGMLHATVVDIYNQVRNALKHGPLQPERQVLEQIKNAASEALSRLENA